MKRLTLSALALAFFALVIIAASWQSKPVAAAVDDGNGECQTVKVTSDDIGTTVTGDNAGDWLLETTGTGSGMMVDSASGGSFQLSTPAGGDTATIKTYNYANQLLSQLTSLSYSTYRTAGSAAQDAALKIEVDTNGTLPSGYTTLVFEPVYNTTQGTVTNNTNQTWNAVNGGSAIFWSTRDLYDASNNLIACNPNGALAGTPQCVNKLYVSLATIQAAFPSATIISIGAGQGSGNAGLTTVVDDLNIGFNNSCVTYKFEQEDEGQGQNPAVQACKNGGWATQRDASGQLFRNQGQCVSYFVHQGHNGTPTPTASPSPTPTGTPAGTPSPTPSPSPSPTASPTPSNNPGAACMNLGWRNLTDGNGRPFRNQGQCVAYYNSHSGDSDDQ